MASKKIKKGASGSAASRQRARAGAPSPAKGTLKRSARPSSPKPAKSSPKPARSSAKRAKRGAKAAPARATPNPAAPKRTARQAAKRTAKRAATKPTATQKRRTQKRRSSTPKPPVLRAARKTRRRDGAGHLDPQYAADLMAQSGTASREREPKSFVEDASTTDDLAENLGEEFVESATSGENQEEELLDAEVPEERGGPFVQTPAGTEFAEGTDASNPKGSKREPFPTT